MFYDERDGGCHYRFKAPGWECRLDVAALIVYELKPDAPPWAGGLLSSYGWRAVDPWYLDRNVVGVRVDIEMIGKIEGGSGSLLTTAETVILGMTGVDGIWRTLGEGHFIHEAIDAALHRWEGGPAQVVADAARDAMSDLLGARL